MANHDDMRVLILQEDGHYVAQCLDVDVAAQGRGLREVRNNFVAVFVGHEALAEKAGRVPFAGLDKAPDWYWKCYETGVALPDLDIPPLPAPAVRTHRLAFKVA